jgi:hypothetical protein
MSLPVKQFSAALAMLIIWPFTLTAQEEYTSEEEVLTVTETVIAGDDGEEVPEENDDGPALPESEDGMASETVMETVTNEIIELIGSGKDTERFYPFLDEGFQRLVGEELFYTVGALGSRQLNVRNIVYDAEAGSAAVEADFSFVLFFDDEGRVINSRGLFWPQLNNETLSQLNPSYNDRERLTVWYNVLSRRIAVERPDSSVEGGEEPAGDRQERYHILNTSRYFALKNVTVRLICINDADEEIWSKELFDNKAVTLARHSKTEVELQLPQHIKTETTHMRLIVRPARGS